MPQIIPARGVLIGLRLALQIQRIAAVRMVEFPDGARLFELRCGGIERRLQNGTGCVCTVIAHAAQGGPVGHAVPGRTAPHTQLEPGIAGADGAHGMYGEEALRVEKALVDDALRLFRRSGPHNHGEHPLQGRSAHPGLVDGPDVMEESGFRIEELLLYELPQSVGFLPVRLDVTV